MTKGKAMVTQVEKEASPGWSLVGKILSIFGTGQIGNVRFSEERVSDDIFASDTFQMGTLVPPTVTIQYGKVFDIVFINVFIVDHVLVSGIDHP
jgi:hypothetical protein